MSIARALLLLTFVSVGLGAADANAQDKPARIRLKVGESTSLTLVTVQTQCDDLSIVKVEAVDKVIRLTGLKEGKTLCGFWQTPAFRRLYEIVVVPAP